MPVPRDMVTPCIAAGNADEGTLILVELHSFVKVLFPCGRFGGWALGKVQGLL